MEKFTPNNEIALTPEEFREWRNAGVNLEMLTKEMRRCVKVIQDINKNQIAPLLAENNRLKEQRDRESAESKRAELYAELLANEQSLGELIVHRDGLIAYLKLLADEKESDLLKAPETPKS